MEFDKCLDKDGKYKTTKKNHKLLFKKVESGDVEFLTKVLDCSPEMVDVIGEGSSWYLGKTPLMYAFQCAQADVCNLLLDRGANVNFTMPDGPTMCGWAATLAASREGEDSEFVKILVRVLEKGASPEQFAPDSDGRDPVAHALDQYTAANSPHFETIRLLLEAGADPDRTHRDELLWSVQDYTYTDVNGQPQTRRSNLALEIFAWYGISEEEVEAARKEAGPPPEPPFLSHPDGEHKKAKNAIAAAMKRLDEMGEVARWIRFDGQGRGQSDEQYDCEHVNYRNGVLDLQLDDDELNRLLARSKVPAEKILRDDDGRLVVTDLTPSQRASLLDGVFLIHFGLKKTLRGNDYGLVVEWV